MSQSSMIKPIARKKLRRLLPSAVQYITNLFEYRIKSYVYRPEGFCSTRDTWAIVEYIPAVVIKTSASETLRVWTMRPIFSRAQFWAKRTTHGRPANKRGSAE